MANYTAKDLRNITKDELVELLKKEGIEFDPTTSFFALRALLLNESKNNDSENKDSESEGGETENNESKNGETPNPDAENDESDMSDNGNTENNESENKDGETENKPTVTNALNALRSEVVKRRGGVGLGKSAFAAELAKRRGERVTGITFAQELRSRQLKYSGK